MALGLRASTRFGMQRIAAFLFFLKKNLNLSLIAGDIRTKANSLSRKVPA